MEAVQPIRTLVIDDEPDAREGIVAMLRQDDDIAVLGEARSGREAVEQITRLRPELVYLDVQMPTLDGFGVLAEIGDAEPPVVVFVTAFDEYALRAFEVHALDYLLKPFSDARFAEALAAAKERVRQRRACALSEQLATLLRGAPSRTPAAEAAGSPEEAAPPPRYLDRIMVRIARSVTFVPVDEIDWIEADDYYARLHVGGRSHLIRETMQQLELKLDPRQFIRVHRSAIVRIDRVQTLHPYFKGAHVLTLKDGTRLTLSRSRREAFERALGGRM